MGWFIIYVVAAEERDVKIRKNSELNEMMFPAHRQFNAFL